MSTAASVQALGHENYLNVSYGVKSWLLTTDHKRIALLYLVSITLFFFLGGAFAVLIRLNLLTPQGDLVSAETYNKFFTMHGVVMIFFFLIPSIPAVLGNFLIPLMIGAKDLAFPRLNLSSWYIFNLGGLFTLYSIIRGGVDTGWTFYTPYSSLYSNTHVVATVVGIFITGFSTILTGLNFIVTIHTMRAPGMTWFRLPLFVWTHYATSLIMILGTPVVAITLALVAVERVFHLGIFNPALGGDPVLFQHLFWFYSHPAVYIMVLPAMGVTTELITTFARKKLFAPAKNTSDRCRPPQPRHQHNHEHRTQQRHNQPHAQVARIFGNRAHQPWPDGSAERRQGKQKSADAFGPCAIPSREPRNINRVNTRASQSRQENCDNSGVQRSRKNQRCCA